MLYLPAPGQIITGSIWQRYYRNASDKDFGGMTPNLRLGNGISF
jgi:hypothetical protein